MLDQFYTGFADTQRPALKQYCKMENVLPAALACAGKPRNAIKLRLEKITYQVLQSMNKKLNVMISRLTADMEFNSMVQGRLS